MILSSYCIMAQDIIVFEDGNEVQAKVTEVSSMEIKYKKFSNLNGPTYIAAISDVVRIDYENGEREIFDKSESQSSLVRPVKALMKYRDLKDGYDYRAYYPSYDDKYSPVWCGIASLFIPGLGQAITGEWGRAAGFFVTNVAMNLTMSSLFTSDFMYKNQSSRLIVFSCMAASIGLNIWSIIDASRIAKVKDLYIRNTDLASLNVSLSPQLVCVPSGIDGVQPTAGLSLKISF